MRCHFSPTRLVKIKVSYHIVYLREFSEAKSLIYSWWELVQPLWKSFGSIHENEKCAYSMTQEEFSYQVSNAEKLSLLCSRRQYYNVVGNIK